MTTPIFTLSPSLSLLVTERAMKKILVIEDNPNVRENIQEILELEDFEPITAENGKLGFQLAQEQIPDLILCDVMMPEMDGYEVLSKLRSQGQTAHIPFIFLTAKADKSDVKKGIDLGANDYLTKPFTATQILNCIATQLENQQVVG